MIGALAALGVGMIGVADAQTPQFQLTCDDKGVCTYKSLTPPVVRPDGSLSHPETLAPITVTVNEGTALAQPCPYWVFINGRWIQIGPPCY
jgi:hypothetical protein